MAPIRKALPPITGTTLIKTAQGGRAVTIAEAVIRAQPRIITGERPLVAFDNIGELMQWSLWVYINLRLPLAAAGNDTLTVYLARRYATDSLVCDARSCAHLVPLLRRAHVPLKEIIVIDDDFSPLSKLQLRGLRVVRATADPARGITAVSESGSVRHTRRALPAIPGIRSYKPGHRSALSLVLVYSSGTTGAPKLFIKKTENVPRARRKVTAFGNLLFLMGADRLAVNFYKQAALTHDMTAQKFFAISSRAVREGNHAPALAALRPTDLMTTPVLFRHLVDNLRRHRALKVLSHVRRITLSQSIPERSTYELARRACPRATLLPRYGASETGFVGMSCPALSRRLLKRYLGVAAPLHPLPRVRIHKPDQSGVGEVWVRRRGTWVHTGDAGSLDKRPCPCGATRTLILYGRLENDRIASMGAMFLASEVARVAALLSRYIKDYRLEVGERGARKPLGMVRLSVVPTPALRARRDAKAFIARRFAGALPVTKTRTLAKLVCSGVFAPVEVILASSFPFEVKPLRLNRLLKR